MTPPSADKFVDGIATSHDDEFFGSPARAALMKRSRHLWSLLHDNPRFSYYGRAVALAEPDADTVEIVSALARIQGATICNYYPSAQAAELQANLSALGFMTDRHEHFRGADDAYAASLAIDRATPLPGDLTMVAIDPNTPHETVAGIAALCQACDVMPVPGTAMRGQVRPGICLAAIDRTGKPVATASSFLPHHASSPHATDAFWGMLATHPDRRGERIALLLGARAIIHLWERHGARGFITGVRAENQQSAAICRKLKVEPTAWIYAHCIDVALYGEKSITK